jgi:hypothetical protein
MAAEKAGRTSCGELGGCYVTGIIQIEIESGHQEVPTRAMKACR